MGFARTAPSPPITDIKTHRAVKEDTLREHFKTSGCFWGFLFSANNMETGQCHAALIIEPDHDLAPSGIDVSVVRTANAITISAAGQDIKHNEWSRLKQLPNVCDHGFKFISSTLASQGIRGICDRLRIFMSTPRMECPAPPTQGEDPRMLVMGPAYMQPTWGDSFWAGSAHCQLVQGEQRLARGPTSGKIRMTASDNMGFAISGTAPNIPCHERH